MRRRTVARLVSGAVLSGALTGLCADGKYTPYQEIVTRNAFALKAIPAPVPLDQAPPPNRVEVKLTGITTILVGGAPKAFLQVVDPTPGKKPEYPILMAGEAQGSVEVVSIDANDGHVVVRIDGNEKTLTFERDAPKSVGGGPGGLMPGLTGVHPASAAPIPAVPLPTSPNPSGAPAAPPYGRYGGVAVGGAQPAAGMDARTQAALQIEERRKMMQEAERLGLVKKGAMPPLPPTPLTPGATP